MSSASALPKTIVVNRHFDAFDIYIGRKKDTPFHYGNPFFVGESAIGSVSVESRKEAVTFHLEWLRGSNPLLAKVEPERRQWILANMEKDLKGKRIACTCVPHGVCHGHGYLVMLGEMTMEELLAMMPMEAPKRVQANQMDMFG